MQQANAVYEGQKIIIPTQGEADSLYQDGYGHRLENRDFSLTPSEALYLVEKERLTIIDEDEKKDTIFSGDSKQGVGKGCTTMDKVHHIQGH